MATTIAAISSPPGGGLRGVIRLSGPECARIVAATCCCDPAFDATRRAALGGRFDDGRGTQPLLLLWMPGPHSSTREDVAELHLPGSPPLLEAALARVFALGAVAAQPGEFTRRAFEHGRIDLVRAEGVLDLIEAENEEERRAATLLFFGGLSERVAGLRERLVELRVLCESSLDFDESDTGNVPREELARLAFSAGEALRSALSWEVRRGSARAEPRIVLAGQPNAGKSSLYNALTGARALVSQLAGTTRDSLRAAWMVGGVECVLCDTAGLEDRTAALDDPSRSAQEFAGADQASADLLLWVVDARRTDDAELHAEALRLPQGPRRVLAWTQTDRAGARAAPPAALLAASRVHASACVSAATGAGLPRLAAAVAEALGLTAAQPPRSHGVREIALRHRAALENAATELERARTALARGEPLDLVAEGLRGATDALDAIAGRTLPEDLLDRIFARFCLGK